MAHKGMTFGAKYVYRRLKESAILDKALALYPEYGLVLTGHSLGAGVAALLAIIMRPKYPDLRVYAFAAPAGLLSREAARVTESFVFTVGVGDDFVMRLGVDSIENVRTGIIQTLHASRLPKYRILLNGFGYALFGVPPGDLESTWKNDDLESTTPGTSPLLGRRPVPTVAASTVGILFIMTTKSFISHSFQEAALLSREIGVRRFSKTRLFTPGRILHIVSRKKTKAERKAGTGGPSFEMRWATAEDFMEFKIMPKMLLDHLPENVYKTLETILTEHKNHTSEVV
ncbi:diacylglycerol lipase -related [Holotrichia oblita]|uniref:Diacylglycerol lipase -related n=1 Tax=Holotrichia oblita TaxID=644536 RepID=A0ACB9T5S1_HOLOL|nr:diacylglycerol lipase -related [Holotrichia oblita]